jgi:hypothetical protein
MKKTFSILAVAGLALAFSSCTRSEVVDPDWNAPAGYYILVEGSVSPAVQLIDGFIHTSTIKVKVTDSLGNKLANKTVFLEQLADSSSTTQLNWGYFPNNKSTYQMGTNADGEINITFYWPTIFYSNEMWIHAILVVDGRAYRNGAINNISEDYISLAMYRAGSSAAK